MKKGSIIIFIIVCLISFCSSVNAGNIVNYIVLDGPHKFSSGDNPAWSLPQYDDSTWQKITVPGSWQSHRIKSIKGMGGLLLWDYSTGFFIICVMYALTARYMRIKELQSASVRIFKAHEDARKRLARELHDGIGTSLQAIKLRLQMLDAKIKGTIHRIYQETISNAIKHSGATSVDVILKINGGFFVIGG